MRWDGTLRSRASPHGESLPHPCTYIDGHTVQTRTGVWFPRPRRWWARSHSAAQAADPVILMGGSRGRRVSERVCQRARHRAPNHAHPGTLTGEPASFIMARATHGGRSMGHQNPGCSPRWSLVMSSSRLVTYPWTVEGVSLSGTFLGRTGTFCPPVPPTPDRWPGHPVRAGLACGPPQLARPALGFSPALVAKRQQGQRTPDSGQSGPLHPPAVQARTHAFRCSGSPVKSRTAATAPLSDVPPRAIHQAGASTRHPPVQRTHAPSSRGASPPDLLSRVEATRDS